MESTSRRELTTGQHGLASEVDVELERQELLSARDLKTINGWIFDHHNCRQRGTIVVPGEFWELADNGTREILINVARIEVWRYRIDPVASSLGLEFAEAE